ncbi:MAG: DUF4352 domain-containing protein [Eubacterium sp.]|nr:DUF4352 domain-containing protein [Eubacterium sp.]
MANEMNTNNVEVQQAVDTALKGQKKKKKTIIFSVIAVIILLIIIIASVGGNSSDEPEIESITNSVSDNQDTSNSSDTPTNQAIEAGNVVTTKNLKVSYISCNTDYKDYNEYLPPKSGNKIVRAELSIENTSSTAQYISGFECYADNQKCDAYFGTDDATLSYDTISAGRASTMILYFEVPENAKNIELEFQDNVWSNDKTKFVIK